MYETIDPETGKQVIMYELNPSAVIDKIIVDFKTTGPIYISKNSHKRTNKRKR